MSRLLKLQQLKDAGACLDQVELFRATFGEQVKVTVDLALSYHDKFDWDFAARKFLTASARAEYDKVRVPAWAEYDKVRASAWAEYVKVEVPAWATAYIADRCE